MKTPKICSLAAHIENRQAIAKVRHEAQGRADVALTMLERRFEFRELTNKISELEETIARISDTQKPQHYTIGIGSFRLSFVISDRVQLAKLVAVLKGRRTEVAGEGGKATIAWAQELESLLKGEVVRQAVHEEDPPQPDPPRTNGMQPLSPWGD